LQASPRRPAEKKKALAKPRGVTLITPESIEALLSRRPADARKIFAALDFIVVDELHAFLRGPRGIQLASLFRRIEAFAERPVRRLGLSATIGDLREAAAWLRPSNPGSVEILEAKSDSPELRLQIRAYVEPAKVADPDSAETGDEDQSKVEDVAVGRVALDPIADHLFATLRGSNNLVFGGSRRTVEAAADRLRRRSERAGVPNEFYPHHGSLSKALREELEERLKAGDKPTTAVCTSTLELGIDIGSVKSVAQIGAPRSLSSLRQRLGRSGRRAGTPAIMRIYVREPNVDRESSVLDWLHAPVTRAMAAVRLLVAGFVEPAATSPEAASTLIHQTLAMIVERGGIRPKAVFDLLCGAGPFAAISAQDYAELLRNMGSPEHKLIEQAPDGILMLGEGGERIVQSHTFFAVFETPEEWRLAVGGRTLGTLPISSPVYKDCLVVFAGQRWVVLDVDERTNTLDVAPHAGGIVPKFDRANVEPAHDRLAAEMRAVYLSDDVPPYLDEKARELLSEGRDTFREHELSRLAIVPEERDVHVFTWRGSQANEAFAAPLAMAKLPAETHDFGLTIPKKAAQEVASVLVGLSKRLAPDPIEVASFVGNLKQGKFAEFVPDALARRQWAQRNAAFIRQIPKIASSLAP
jgi:ATP-dependent helicase Lhr and Lhr-like helicase